MKLFFPDNFYTRLFADHLPDEYRNAISYLPSSAIPGELKKDETSGGLITPTDILSNPSLFISLKTGISFEGMLSNSYFYFNPGQKEMNSLSLHGDVSSLEVILSKIFFRESYDSEIAIEIVTDLKNIGDKNLLLVGDNNFKDLKYQNGLSFAEEMVDLLALPFVNFIFASASEDLIQKINSASAGISTSIYESIENKSFDKFPPETMAYIRDNAASLIYEFEDQDIDDIHQLIRLPYFYGLIQDIVEPKFV